VEAEGIGRYPQETEAAVYFCCLEALQNVQKYAQATSATVRILASVDELTVMVDDDGRGFDTKSTRRGSGLQNMEDRLDALGGAIEVVSAPGSGTTVTARVPVRATALTA
jgi:signal transduction histidine kinase